MIDATSSLRFVFGEEPGEKEAVALALVLAKHHYLCDTPYGI